MVYDKSEQAISGRFYHENGKLREEGGYDENQHPSGEWRHYDDAGHLIQIMIYSKEATGVFEAQCTRYHSNGKVSENGKYRNGQQFGEWKYYNEAGNLVKTDHYSLD